jgi:arylsulfatase
MNHRGFFLALMIATVAFMTQASSKRPNIIIAMADDMGWSDIGCYGGEINTPTLNALAEEGVRFTQFYNTGRCCPTRATLLSGVYAHQAGIGWMMSNQNLPGFKGDLGKNVRTIAEVMKTAGYATYMAGKWHVTPHVKPEGPKYNWPRQRGFDRFYGTIHGAGSFFDPNSLTRENTQVSPLTDKGYQANEFYYTDAISDHAVRYIKEHQGDEPFFMYVAYTAPHWPMHAKDKDIARYKGKYDAGWDAVRKARYERQVKMGLIDPKWKITPRDRSALAWGEAKNKQWEIRLMETYAAMVDNLDQGMGRVVNVLKETGEYDNTLILFLADNGGCAEGMGRRNGIQYRDKDPDDLKPMGKGDLQFDMIPRRTRDGRVMKQGTEVMTGGADTYHGYGLSWANASNTPFREYKHWVHEGGISSPLIAHWPKGIDKGRYGKLESQPGHLIDLMATCVDLGKAKYPAKVGGAAIVPMQGTSLVPAFNGRDIGRGKPIFWEHEGNRAMREGKWKLVAKGANSPWELYDIEADRTELNNLAEKETARMSEMADRWEAWAKEALAKPWPWGAKKIGFSKKKNFTLKQGNHLPKTQAPMVRKRGFTVTATVETKGNDGVIVAQGGTNHGWALHVWKGQLAFATRHSGKLTTLIVEESFSKSAVKVFAELKTDGTVTLKVDDKVVAEGKTPGPMLDMPLDGLEVGEDRNGAVGNYPANQKFKGIIKRVSLRLLK